MGLKIDQVISKIRDEWMAIDGVNVVARSKVDGKSCIMVMVTARNPEIEKAIPSETEVFEYNQGIEDFIDILKKSPKFKQVDKEGKIWRADKK